MTYDAANRLVEVRNDANSVVYESYKYGVGNRRVVSESGGMRTYYAGGGGQSTVEYVEAVSGGSLVWSKSFIYMGGSLLATISPNGAGEYVEYHHPDRLGTRLTTNNLNASSYEQASLPYGTALDAESTGATNRRFTSYDRSPSTGLDYAVNRTYDSAQGRFTQVDPIGAGASDITDPQSWNMYAYCGNDPVNHVDPDGLFFKKLFKWISKALKWIAVAVMVAVAVITVVGWFVTPLTLSAFLTTTALGKTLAFIAGIPSMIGGFAAGIGKAAAGVFGFAEAGVSATVAGLIGGGVLTGGSAAAGAISNHLQARGDRRRGRGPLDVTIDRAYIDALRRLRTAKCGGYIKSGGGEDPSNVLKNIYRKRNIKFDASSKVAAATVGAGSKADVTLGYQFFRDNPGGYVGTDPRLPDADSVRTLATLHEVRHATSGIPHKVYTATGQEVQDGNTNADFNKGILDNCF